MRMVGYIVAFLCTAAGSCYCQTKAGLINKIWQAAGGKSTWEQSRFLTFSFRHEESGKTLVNRKYLWDKESGNLRFEDQTEGNKPVIALFNINSRSGQAYINLQLLDKPASNALIKKAYAAFIHDSFWLLMPLKLEDAAISTTPEASKTINGKNYRVLRVEPQKTAAVQAESFWLYVDAANGEIAHSRHMQQGTKKYIEYSWTDYKDLGGGLRLSVRRQDESGNSIITFPGASILVSIEPDKLKKP